VRIHCRLAPACKPDPQGNHVTLPQSRTDVATFAKRP
jgi:hypothetical protein